jgi:hypothetical protein
MGRLGADVAAIIPISPVHTMGLTSPLAARLRRESRPVTEAPSDRDLEVLRASPDNGTLVADDHNR